MYRATPLNTSHRAYSAGGARSVVDTVTDTLQMQEMAGNFLKGEQRDKIEAPQNYGFSSVVQAAKKGADGQISESAEAFISFIGGNRSFPVAAIMDDRRFRPMGLRPGENAQYDDLGQMTLLRRTGLYLLTTNTPDKSQQQQSGGGGATPTQQAGEQQQSADRFVSIRHVEKKEQDRTPVSETDPETGQQRSEAQINALVQQQQQQRQNHRHEGESVNMEVRVSKDKIEFRSGDEVVGKYDKQQKAWFFVGKVYLGLDQITETSVPKVATVDGPAKQTFAKVGT